MENEENMKCKIHFKIRFEFQQHFTTNNPKLNINSGKTCMGTEKTKI